MDSIRNLNENNNTPATHQQGNRVVGRVAPTREITAAHRMRSMLDLTGNACNREANPNGLNNTVAPDQQDNHAGQQPRGKSSVAPPRRRSMLDCPGIAWNRQASRLAQWTQERLVNRTDVYGSYRSPGWRVPGQSNNYTAPWKEEERLPGALNAAILEEHYHGCDQGQLIGLHAISAECTCKWFLIDIDQHGENGAAVADVNAKAAFGWNADLQRQGFHPLLLDSNGAGGYHLLVVLSEAVASQRVYAFARQFVQDYAERGLAQVPEVFPKQAEVNAQHPYGGWWRLPGRHHTRDHWTKVWDGKQWLEDDAAIDLIVSVTGDSSDLIPEIQDRQASSTGRPGVGERRPSYESPYDCDHWLDILQGKEPGSRHDSLLQLAGFLLGKRIPAAIVEELCVVWNEARNDPPREEEHIRQTVQDLVQRDIATTAMPRNTANQTRVYRV
ncbi:MAG: primase C-terminal domain-containing protein [Thermoguttaceae bacterium]